METTEKVMEILKELSGKEEIKGTDSLQTDLALDSLSLVTLLLEVEDAFSIQLDESDMNPYDLETVDDVVALAGRYCNEKES